MCACERAQLCFVLGFGALARTQLCRLSAHRFVRSHTGVHTLMHSVRSAFAQLVNGRLCGMLDKSNKSNAFEVIVRWLNICPALLHTGGAPTGPLGLVKGARV